MLSRFLLVALVLLSAVVVVSFASGSSDVECGPIRGSLPVSDGRAPRPVLTAADARAAALVAVPPAAVTDVDLEDEDGFLVYEVGLVHDREDFDVVVDAGTGEVLCTERD